MTKKEKDFEEHLIQEMCGKVILNSIVDVFEIPKSKLLEKLQKQWDKDVKSSGGEWRQPIVINKNQGKQERGLIPLCQYFGV